ncbi:MAG: tetratricopeptide repeat protein [Gemmatimonadetes bacterium]|nr:tetratricopeptide repeat protein [Gemmatimonadota bacterium]
MADSIAKLEKALRRDPDSPRFARLADLFLKRGHIERAIELCQKGCASFPDYATGFIVLSKCYEKRGDLEQARETMGQALRIDPENPSGYKRLAHLFEQLDVAPLALQSLRQAAYFDPFDTSLAEQIDRFTSQTHQEAPVPESEPESEPKPESEPEEVATVASAALVESTQPQALPPNQSPDDDRDDLYGDTDDRELLRLLQEIEEEEVAEPAPAPEEPPTPADNKPSTPKNKRIATMTLAEIYTTQGLTQKAIEMYRELLEQEPNNTIIRSKLASLEQSSNAH